MADDKVRLYDSTVAAIFKRHYRSGAMNFPFARAELAEAATHAGLSAAKNLGDIVYTYCGRRALPELIRKTQPKGYEWMIRTIGIGRYEFRLVEPFEVVASKNLVRVKIPLAVPSIIDSYSKRILKVQKKADEQSLLAKLRYNRLIDTFLGITCYSLQNHLRTTVADVGQVEVDELYFGVDAQGVHYVVPVEAKSRSERIGRCQLEKNFALCRERLPSLRCIPVAAQMLSPQHIVLFSFGLEEGKIVQIGETHYELIDAGSIAESDLDTYRNLPRKRNF